MAKETGGNVGELLEQHFHRRLIARVFDGAEADKWVLKGGQALLVRWPTARYSTDVDLLSAEATTDAAVEALKVAAARRLDDDIWFGHLGTSVPAQLDRPTRAVKFMAMFGNASLEHRVKVDVVVSAWAPRGEVVTEPLEPVYNTDCAPWPLARLYPFEDHVAEKICAMYERHRADGQSSTRYKDLVDLVLVALKVRLPGPGTHRILRDEVTRRRQRGITLELPDRFDVPDLGTWRGGYDKVAAGVLELPEHLRRFDEAEKLAHDFLTSLLRSEPPTGSWDPDLHTWSA